MDPITLLLVAGAVYGLAKIKSYARQGSGRKTDSKSAEDWKFVSTEHRDLLINRKSAGGDHFTYNRGTKELHATFDFRKMHVPIEKGLGGIVEWETLLNQDNDATRQKKMNYLKGVGVNFKPGQRFTYDHPWYPDDTTQKFDEKWERILENRLSYVEQRVKYLYSLEPASRSIGIKLDLSRLTTKMFDDLPKSVDNAWDNFRGTGTVVQTNPWNSFNQPLVGNERERILENLSKYKLPEPISHDSYLVAQENAKYWDKKVGCGYFRPGEAKDMSDYCVEHRIMKASMERTMNSLMMTKEEVSSIFSGIKSNIRTYSASDFNLPRSSAWR